MNTFPSAFRHVSGLCLAASLVAGCAVAPAPTSPVPPAWSAARTAWPGDEAADALRGGHLPQALAAAHRWLARAPRDPQAHLLAGLVYQLMALAGDDAAAGLAETAYRVALRLDPHSARAAHQLGRLYLHQRRHDEAQRSLLLAWDLERDNRDILQDLAAASYALGDAGTALATLRLAERAERAERADAHEGPDVDSEFHRTAAFIKAAAGLDDEARGEAGRLAAEGPEVQRRLRDLRSDHRAHLREARVEPEPGSTLREAAERAPTLSADWTRCDRAADDDAGRRDAGDGPGPAGHQDDLAPRPALPSPCAGQALPRMAVIEATLISYDDRNSTSSGLDVLGSLQLVFGGSLATTRSSGTAGDVVTRTLSRSVGLPAAGIAYSLNIASAADQRNQIVARPTLLALDRKPSTVFSGVTLSVALAGTALSGGSIQDRSIGSGLTVTPTFVNDEQMLLALQLNVSSITEAAGAGFGPGTLATQRSTFTANLRARFDQTVILSGIEFVETEQQKTGTPGLKDVPGLQYLFANAKTRERRVSALIVLTPRRPPDATGSSPTASAEAPLLADLQAVAAQSGVLPPHQAQLVAKLRHSTWARQVRPGDVRVEAWREGSAFERLLADWRRFAYF